MTFTDGNYFQVCLPSCAFSSWVQPPILTISSNLAIVAKLGYPKCLQNLHLNSDVTSFSCLIQSRGRQIVNNAMVNIDFRHEVFIFHKPNWCNLIVNYFRHQTPCGIRKLTTAFVSKIGVFVYARFRCQNGGISTSGSPNLTIPKTSRYSNPVDEYSCIRM